MVLSLKLSMNTWKPIERFIHALDPVPWPLAPGLAWLGSPTAPWAFKVNVLHEVVHVLPVG